MARRPSGSPPSRGGRQPQRPPPRSASRRKRERRRTVSAQGGTRQAPLWRRRGVLAGAAAVLLLAVVLVVVLLTRGPGPKPVATPTPRATPAPTPVPTPLASRSAAITGQPIDGIDCQAKEQIGYHIHAHLSIFVNGVERSIPEGVGVVPPLTTVPTNEGPYVESGKCFYWLHTHTDDGIVHVESPDQRQYTMGQFFDLWQQTLGATAVGPASGQLFVYVDGKKFTGDPRTIAFAAHELVQLDVGTDVAPKAFSFPPGL